MKEKTTKKFDAINKNAVVGNQPKIVKFDFPSPRNSDGTKKATIKPSKKKRRKCSGCSRNRKRE